MGIFDIGSVKGRRTLFIVGFVIVLIMGVWLIWVGFRLGAEDEPTAEPRLPATATIGSVQESPATATPVLVEVPVSPLPTDTAQPPPAATAEPSAIPPTDTPPPPIVVTGQGGVNVRSGPSTDYAKLGSLQPNSEAPLLGRYSDWWQIEYNGAPAWVSGGYVTARNAESVPEAVPPPSPVPPPPQPTAPPAPTEVPATQAPSDVRGLEARDYQVEGAPGPFGVGRDIWFNMWVTNISSSEVPFTALGTTVGETGQFQKSWTHSEFEAGQRFEWRDHINIPNAGTYSLWLTICFHDGECSRLRGPVQVVVQ